MIMTLLNKVLTTTGLLTSLFLSSNLYANNASELQKAYQSTNIKSALINVCKKDTSKGGKLTAAEVNKFCSCQIEAEGRITTAQKWEIQSAINAKKNPSSLAVIQQQNKALRACFGPQLTAKLQSLSEQAMRSAPAKK